MQILKNGFPRRNCIDHYTSEELALREAIFAVERMGAHPLLTEAVMLIGAAKDKVSDFVELLRVTDAQEKLRAKHGDPDEFAIACNRAADRLMISTEECDAGVEKYRREWLAAGRVAEFPMAMIDR